MARHARDIPSGFWGIVATFIAILALTVLLLSDDLLLFILFDSFGSMQVDLSLRLTVALVLTILNIGLAIFAFSILKKKPETGADAMIGMKAMVARATETETWIKVRGELWRAQCSQTLHVGEEVQVTGIDGLILHIEKINSQ
jgi:membrane protein implicated in regulation of membrane protease activity